MARWKPRQPRRINLPPARNSPRRPPASSTKVNVIAGQQVQKGDVLVELNSGTATFASAQAEVERQKKLYAQQNTSLKNLQDAEAQLASLQIVAPLSGTVTRLNVKPGEAVDVNTVGRGSDGFEPARRERGNPGGGGKRFENRPGSAGAKLKRRLRRRFHLSARRWTRTNGTVLMRALLPADSGLRPGQFVPLRIVTAVHTNCLAAPSESVVTDESGKSVIALVNGDEAAQTPVQTGLRENGWVEVAAHGTQGRRRPS